MKKLIEIILGVLLPISAIYAQNNISKSDDFADIIYKALGKPGSGIDAGMGAS